MATALDIATRFTAIDKFSSVVKKMTRSTQIFSDKAVKSFTRVQRAERKMRRGFSKSLGLFGQFGVGLGTGMIAVDSVKKMMNYEQANADLAAVLGKTVAETKLLQADSIRLGSITAKSSTEVVALQEAYARLGFSQSEILNMTESTINGSIAMNAELASTAELTGAMVRTFDNFSSLDTPAILDQMTLSTQKSALNFEKLKTALPIVSGAANSAGVPFTRLLALMGKLSDAGIDASSSSTALRNIFLDSASKGHSYDQILQNIQDNQNKLTAANDKFGKRGAISAVILAKNIKETDSLTGILNSAAKGHENAGVAAKVAESRSDTLQGSLILLSSAWDGFLLKVNKSSGSLNIFKKIVDFVTQNLGTLMNFVALAGGIYISFKAIVFAVNVVMKSYNIIMKLITISQLKWNASMLANPIGLIIAGIVIMIAAIYLAINNWEKWGASMVMALGPLGLIISMIQMLRKHWEGIQSAFQNEGIIAGLRAIGIAIIDMVLLPVQQLLELLSQIPVIGDTIGIGATKIKDFRKGLGIDTGDSEPTSVGKEAINADATQTQVNKMLLENKGNATLNINDKSGLAKLVENNGLDINLSQTGQY